jgi:hypothetical protein
MIFFETAARISIAIIFFFGISSLVATYMFATYEECSCGKINKIHDGWAYCPNCNTMKKK